MDVIMYQNPACGTSRITLGLIRNAGIEPHIIEYLKTPPTRLLLRQLLARGALWCQSLTSQSYRRGLASVRSRRGAAA